MIVTRQEGVSLDNLNGNLHVEAYEELVNQGVHQETMPEKVITQNDGADGMRFIDENKGTPI